MTLPSLDQIRDAQTLVYQHMLPTPQYSWPLINQRLGTEAWIKHENHTPIGAFKLRSALVYAAWLKQTQPELAGIVAATRGNFGQGAAMAARLLGMKAVIVVPHGNSAEKNRAMQAQGAELVEHGHDFQEALEFASTLARRTRLRKIRVIPRAACPRRRHFCAGAFSVSAQTGRCIRPNRNGLVDLRRRGRAQCPQSLHRDHRRHSRRERCHRQQLQAAQTCRSARQFADRRRSRLPQAQSGCVGYHLCPRPAHR